MTLSYLAPPGSGEPPLGYGVLGLVALMTRLRRDCPWDAEQTHLSLAKHLIEETFETVDAIEAGSDDDLIEELGDVLLQVVFHAEIGRCEHKFDIDTVAGRVTEKLIARHPFVFGDAQLPSDMMATWEGAKRTEKHRDSALDGIADSMSSLARAAKVATRLSDMHIDDALVPPTAGETDQAFEGSASIDVATRQDDQVGASPNQSLDAAEVGRGLLALVVAAVKSGVDPDQALRMATREWEQYLRDSGV